MYWIGYQRESTTDLVVNIDLLKNAYSPLIHDVDFVNTVPTGLCIGITLTLDPTTMEVITSVNTKDCADLNNYICKFYYSNNAIIYVSTSKENWFEAEEQCQMKGGNLASIHDATEQDVYNCLLSDR